MELVSRQTLDEQGRLPIPAELRNHYDWEQGDTISMYEIDINTIALQLYDKSLTPRCVLCKEFAQCTTIDDNSICSSCIDAVRQAYAENN